MTDEGHVFISYSRKDGIEYAEQLELALKSQFKTWRDTRNIDPTQDFTAEIENGIEGASHVVVCVTPDSKRGDSFVRREIQYALLSMKPVIPLRFADIIPHISIVNFEWIDFFKEWNESFERLCAVLNNTADEFRARTTSSDPFHEYLKALYDQVVYYLNQTVFSLITLTAKVIPDAVEADSQVLPMAFFAMAGIEEQVNENPRFFNRFYEAFEKYGGRVLLLGEPGLGKTTTLFAFARDAVAARLEDSSLPLPILAPIVTWDSEKQTPLTEWLMEAISALRQGDIERLIQTGKALLILDGLDELGSYRKHPDTEELYDPRQRFLSIVPKNNQIVVTSRIDDYNEIGEKIRLNVAIALQLLDDEQIHEYLWEMPDLWAVLKKYKKLRDVARTPMLLSYFAHAFAGLEKEVKKLRNLKHGELRDKIFRTYIHRRYEHEERKLKMLGEKIPFSQKEIYEVLGVMGTRSAARGAFFADVFFTREDMLTLIKLGIDNIRIQELIELATNLHILVWNNNKPLRFIHLLLRDYFAFEYALPRLGDPKPFVRLSAGVSLGVIKDVRAVPNLIKALHDPDWQVMRSAVISLGHIKDARAVPILIEMLDSSDTMMRLMIANTLEAIRDPRAVPALIKLLSDKKRPFSISDESDPSDDRVCDHAANALERIGTEEG